MKRLVVFLLTILLVLFSVGCSSSDQQQDNTQNIQQEDTKETTGEVKDSQDNKEDANEPKDSEDSSLTEGEYFEDPLEFAQYFKEIEYTFEIIDPSGLKLATTSTYLYLGKEDVDGVSANKYQFSEKGSTTTIWVTDNNEFLKTVVNGVEYGPEQAEMFFLSNLALFVYSDSFDEVAISEAKKESSVKRNLGAGNVKITQYKFEGGGGSASYELAELDGRKFFVGIQSSAPEEGSFNFTVTKLIPR